MTFMVAAYCVLLIALDDLPKNGVRRGCEKQISHLFCLHC